jgi:hypothetical protein
MPFGLSNAGGTFQRIQNKIFETYLGQYIRAFLDNFCVYGRQQDHLQQLHMVFSRLLKFRGSLAPKKCSLDFQEISLLGHIVFQGGLRVDEEKIEKD